MSQPPIHNRPDEEALAALLIIAALSFGTLFAVTKTVTNRFTTPTPKKDKSNRPSQPIDPELQLRSSQRHRNREHGLATSRAWADATTSTNIDRAGRNIIPNDHRRGEDNRDAPVESVHSRTLTPPQVILPNNHQHNNNAETKRLHSEAQRHRNREQGVAAIAAWEEARRRRMEQESRVRWPEGVASLDKLEMRQERDGEAVMARERAVRRGEVRKMGVEAVSAWQQGKMRQWSR